MPSVKSLADEVVNFVGDFVENLDGVVAAISSGLS